MTHAYDWNPGYGKEQDEPEEAGDVEAYFPTPLEAYEAETKTAVRLLDEIVHRAGWGVFQFASESAQQAHALLDKYPDAARFHHRHSYEHRNAPTF